MRKSLILIPAALIALVLASCTRSSVQYSFTKTFSSQQKIDAERQQLIDTEGVNKAIINISSGDVVTLDLYVDKHDPQNALGVAAELGYVLVRN